MAAVGGRTIPEEIRKAYRTFLVKRLANSSVFVKTAVEARNNL